MLSVTQSAGLTATFQAAKASGHIWPAYAACEGALESAWFSSGLYKEDNNVFGTKQHQHPIFGTHNIPTKEFLHNEWVTVEAAWVHYPTLSDALADRMQTLRNLARNYPHYAAALVATTGEDFVTQVSRTWSTDPDRAKKVLEIFDAHVRGEAAFTV
jgi:flagellum-specific peptidoglycan hydrolase FlgJ